MNLIFCRVAACLAVVFLAGPAHADAESAAGLAAKYTALRGQLKEYIQTVIEGDVVLMTRDPGKGSTDKDSITRINDIGRPPAIIVEDNSTTESSIVKIHKSAVTTWSVHVDAVFT